MLYGRDHGINQITNYNMEWDSPLGDDTEDENVIPLGAKSDIKSLFSEECDGPSVG